MSGLLELAAHRAIKTHAEVQVLRLQGVLQQATSQEVDSEGEDRLGLSSLLRRFDYHERRPSDTLSLQQLRESVRRSGKQAGRAEGDLSSVRRSVAGDVRSVRARLRHASRATQGGTGRQVGRALREEEVLLLRARPRARTRATRRASAEASMQTSLHRVLDWTGLCRSLHALWMPEVWRRSPSLRVLSGGSDVL